jgi:hypothetical protein
MLPKLFIFISRNIATTGGGGGAGAMGLGCLLRVQILVANYFRMQKLPSCLLNPYTIYFIFCSVTFPV